VIESAEEEIQKAPKKSKETSSVKAAEDSTVVVAESAGTSDGRKLQKKVLFRN
jgi:hypothetical protein